MKRLSVKLLLYLSPVFLLLGTYVYKDPFKVLYHYDNYFAPYDSFYYDTHNDYVITQNLIQKNDQYHYDSYIFGNSRAGNYKISDWTPHINAHNCYNFYCPYESLWGIEKKLEFLANNHYAVKNAMIVLDDFLLNSIDNGKGHLRVKHYKVSGQGRMDFQFLFVGDFFDKDFLPVFLKLTFLGVSYTPIRFSYNTVTNEFLQAGFEKEIARDSIGYYARQTDLHVQRDNVLHYGAPVIGPEQVKMLRHIKSILDKEHTAYRIIISPLFDQLKFNTADLGLLQQIMGKDHVFDFSGISPVTQNPGNYYESSHYRSPVCKMIMDSIYSR